MSRKDAPGIKLGGLVIEGKTKRVWEILSEEKPSLVFVESKDRITAGDGVKAHDLTGKAKISNATNAKVFQILNAVGLKTAFVKSAGDTAFIAERCQMVPIEWVSRRVATGSFLKRHPGVPEGYRFNPPLQETFYKDDANHDPQWSEQQIISAGFSFNGITIGKDEVDYMRRATICVFEVLERAWKSRTCDLIDMKIEFGVNDKGEILVADVIDSDSWRLWPSGDKRLMKDKQVYRNIVGEVTQSHLEEIKRNFEWVAEQLDHLAPSPHCMVVILMGSPSDEGHCKKIMDSCRALRLPVQMRVTSAHKGTADTMSILAEYEGSGMPVVFIAVAGRSNGLGPVLSGNTAFPVINCPPVTADNVDRDIWSSLCVPSGLGCTTVMYPEAAALAAAQIHGLHNHIIWSSLRVRQLNTIASLKAADKVVREK
ncbi:multifunctional protein ADE2 isoform X2 [Ischnura elegans]|uniref:multifunctional protein ADE2 isoform X2 n=1 Tax=Ischnura elegans TaxID=197161 RepID=UPI001ED8840A|nr:multifunctional protein ADE2 isoform X2 [Ischnura elegans]